jgi:hypothetical protein
MKESLTTNSLKKSFCAKSAIEKCIYPAYSEHKEALAFGVYGTPKHAINDRLVPDTESSWGPEECEGKLKALLCFD